MTHSSLFAYLLSHARHAGERTAVLSKSHGAYRAITWSQLLAGVDRVSAALVALGIQPGDRVCLFAGTTLSWLTADLGIIGAGAVPVPLYPSASAEDCSRIIAHADARVVLVDSAAQARRLLPARDRLVDVRCIVQLQRDDSEEHNVAQVAAWDGWVMACADAEALGESISASTLQQRRDGLTSAALASLLYTSGTTGAAKGVMMTHGALIYGAQAWAQMQLFRQDDVQFLFLPLAHSLARQLVSAWLVTPHTLAFAESIDSLRRNLREVKPTVMVGVPRLYERMYHALVQRAAAHGRGVVSVVHGIVASAAWDGPAGGARGEVLRSTLGEDLRIALGGRMRALFSGGAPLPGAVERLFQHAGSEILQLYGLTESGAVGAVSRPGSNRLGTAGLPPPGTQMRIAGDGEVLMRGPGLMRGYWRDPQGTAAAIVEGWLHTGDIGAFDAAGHLRIADRKSHLITTRDGHTVAPQTCENLLKGHPLISQALVCVDGSHDLAVLLTLDRERLYNLVGRDAAVRDSEAILVQRPDVRGAVAEILRAVNAQAGPGYTLQRFVILAQDFSVATGEITPCLKLRRRIIASRYRHLIDACAN